MNKKLKSEKLKWFNDTAKLKDLIPCEDNPRILTEKQRKDLTKSLEKFDLAEVPVIDVDNKIVAGHMRIDILKELYGGDHEIDIRRPNRPLTEKEYTEYLIRSNKNTGEWDFGKLNDDSKFDLGELKEWGFTYDGCPKIDKIEDLGSKNHEIDTENYGNDLQHTCPKCGFEFNE